LQTHQVVTSNEVIGIIESAFGKLESINGGKMDGEAVMYQIPGAKGQVGFISSVSKPFCAFCTRARLTADGKLRLCLLRENEVDLLTPMRNGATDEDLRQMIVTGIWGKPWGHGLADGEIPLNRTMSEIGG
jgi:GTP 3',8-cyclase